MPDLSVDEKTGVRLALVGQDGQSLMCASHGAIYRARDGYCTTGPCSGTSLARVSVRESTGAAGEPVVTVGDDGGPERRLGCAGSCAAIPRLFPRSRSRWR